MGILDASGGAGVEILGFEGSLSLLDGTLFCYPSTGCNGSTRGLLVAFDPASGKTLWTVQTTARGNRGCARAGGTVCYPDKKILHGLDAGNGAKCWAAGAGLGDLDLLGVPRGLILVAGTKGLYAFHADTGEQVGTTGPPAAPAPGRRKTSATTSTRPGPASSPASRHPGRPAPGRSGRVRSTCPSRPPDGPAA
ncbi:outer membrane protein assembly factor BamB family protein, partial [Streptomyces formicae]